MTKDTADHLLASAHTDKSLTYSLNAWITIIATLDPKKNESLLGAWRIAVPPDPKLPDELEKIALIKRTVSSSSLLFHYVMMFTGTWYPSNPLFLL